MSAAPPQPTVALTDDQVRFFQEEGYLVLPQVSAPDEIEAIRRIYDRLFQARAGRETGNQFDLAGDDEEGSEAKLPQILDPSGFAPEMKETLAWANARAVMEQLLGAPLSWQGDHAILKPAGQGAPTPWHQDEAYWDETSDHSNLSCWIPLQDVDIEMGCMHYIPGSHLGEVLKHQQIGNNPKVHGLEIAPDAGVDLTAAVGVPLPAGGCVIHHQRTLHYAPGNTSDQDRRAWIIMGGLPTVKREVPYNFPWQHTWKTARQERAEQTR
ncbi:MAG: phytanoyl-CoA dioxygenase family protein [Fimbriimonadaceae bacterium]|nr:phytanoyl-CoA dioxygenase family protein [Fimbriimonadaceae bacterium]